MKKGSQQSKLICIFQLIRNSWMIPGSLLSFSKQKQSCALLTKNNKVALLLVLMLKMIRKLGKYILDYQTERVKKENLHLPKHLWKNRYPIVLVHGFGGGAPDQSLLTVYFFYALQKIAQPHDDVYLAVVTCWGGLHDRACELY